MFLSYGVVLHDGAAMEELLARDARDVDSQVGPALRDALHGRRFGRTGAAGVFIILRRRRKRGRTTGVVIFRG